MPGYGDWCIEGWQNTVCLRHPNFVGIIIVWIGRFWIVGLMSVLGYSARYWVEWWKNMVCLRHPNFVGIIIVWIGRFWIVGLMSILGYSARYWVEWWKNMVCHRHPNFVGIIIVWIVRFWIVGLMSILGYSARHWLVLLFPFDLVYAAICVTILSTAKAENRGDLRLPWLWAVFKTGNIRRLGQSSGSRELPFFWGVRSRELLCTYPYGVLITVT